MSLLIRKHWFIVGLLGVVALAGLRPEWGAAGGVLKTEWSSTLGIMLIFFLQGWVLPVEQLKRGLLSWRLHLGIQAGIFLAMPLLCCLIAWPLKGLLPQPLWVGMLFLGVLPSTISSAIIYTSEAGGNAAIALVNTTLSNLGGIIITPLWLLILLKTGGLEMQPIVPTLIQVSKLILLPLLAGQLSRLVSHSLADRSKSRVGKANSLIILFIIYASLSDSVLSGAWSGQSKALISYTVGLAVALLLMAHLMVFAAIKWGSFSHEECPAILFCITQKTLAAGVPMAKSVFGLHPMLGLILLPVLVYHPLQLLVGAFWIHHFKAAYKPEANQL